MSIPKIIHQIWIQGDELIPDKFKKNQDKIKELHKDWTYILWDEIKILTLLKDNNLDWLNKYYKFAYLHQKVDYAKLIILYLYGGICIDMDAYAKKKLDDLFEKCNNYDLVVSNFKDLGYIGNYVVCDKFSQCLNNGNFFGKPKTDILKFMIDSIKFECSALDYKIKCIHKTTGPTYFNNVLNDYIKNNKNTNKSKILILENEYLEPCTMDICEITDNTYIIHEHANTWINDYIRFIGEIYLKYNNELFLSIFVIILMITYYLIKKFRYS